ncbi:hypothetical protein OROGR_030732 [Orobanche gracilis]
MGSKFSDAAWSLEMATNDASALHEADIGLPWAYKELRLQKKAPTSLSWMTVLPQL